MNQERDAVIKQAGEWYRGQDYSPEYPLRKIMADFAIQLAEKENDDLRRQLERYEQFLTTCRYITFFHNDDLHDLSMKGGNGKWAYDVEWMREFDTALEAFEALTNAQAAAPTQDERGD
jgi:hypothetical protein